MSAICKLLLAFVFIFVTYDSRSAEPHASLPKALATAEAQGKPIFIYVYDSI